MVTTRLLTAEDLLQLEDDGARYELIEGVLVEVTPPSPEHAYIVANITSLIRDQVRRHSLGRVYTGDPGVLVDHNPDTVVGPDVAVVAANRLPLEQATVMKIPPDWAIEVVSPGNTRREIERKLNLYLAFGVQRVWTVYPGERRVVVHASNADPLVFDDTDVITGIEPFPTVSFQVSDLFD